VPAFPRVFTVLLRGIALTEPIFNAGRTRSRVALSKAQQEEAVLAYQQTIQQSLREVSDALVGYLEVLDSDTRMFSAELGVTQAELSELLSLVQIYRALGGGWQP
jgi:outer membrane protein TolC